MWKIWPTSMAAISFMILTTTLAFTTWTIRYDAPDRTILNFIFVLACSATPIATAAIILGRSPFVWRLTCRCFPSFGAKYDVSGTWNGATRSTYPAGEKIKATNLYSAVMSMEITQSWMHLTVKTTRSETPTLGRSILTNVALNEHGPVFYTVFSGQSFEPTENDSDSWFGSSRFEYDSKKRNLTGIYCSNRGYLKGGSTAGDFYLERQHDFSNTKTVGRLTSPVPPSPSVVP